MRKSSIKYYKKKADKIFGLIIRSRGECEKCGKTEALHCAHVVGRKNLALRWDLMNALALCHKHHIFWQHREPLEFTEWFKEKYPNRYEYISMNKNRIVKRTLEDYKELVKMLQEKLDE